MFLNQFGDEEVHLIAHNINIKHITNYTEKRHATTKPEGKTFHVLT